MEFGNKFHTVYDEFHERSEDLVQQLVRKEEEKITAACPFEISNEYSNEASSSSSNTLLSYQESPPIVNECRQ